VEQNCDSEVILRLPQQFSDLPSSQLSRMKFEVAPEGLELKHVEHFEDDDDNDNDSDDVEDVSVHGSWITGRYPGGEQYCCRFA
jgi:hypothetical protein